MQQSTLNLVADIGGTNARFALVDADERATVLQSPRRYRTADFPGIAAAIARYLVDVAPHSRPRLAALAVASIVHGNEIRITNCPWRFTIDALRTETGLQGLHVVNDFAALAYSVAALGRDDRVAVGGTWAMPPGNGTFAVLGPGTGLGVATLRRAGDDVQVFPSEGGHCAFAPLTDQESTLLTLLRRRYGRVSYERFLSGQGLSNLHAALRGMPDATGMSPEDIVARADDGSDANCIAAVDRFCEILGAFAGDVTLMLGAWDGIYLAGGLVTALLRPLQTNGAFRSRFEAKGRFQATLAGIPSFAIVHPDAGLLGAAVALRRHADC